MRLLYAVLLATIITVPALAQTKQQPAAPAAPSARSDQMPASGQWRASKLIGVDVYNQQNERLGEINELIIEKSGRVAGAVIGVGGFLGVGEHDVLVPMEKLQFATDAGRATTGASDKRANPDATGARSEGRQWYPDRAVMNATKDQLKAMPQFKY